MSTSQDIKETMAAVRALENRLIEVLKTTPEHVGCMAMARLLATNALIKGHSPQRAAEGVLTAYKLLQAQMKIAQAEGAI